MKIEELIERYYDNLNDNDLYIWKYISQHKWECQSISIGELASRCNVSHTTILRFTQKLHLKGYSEFKVYLRWDVNEQLEFDERIIDDSILDSTQLMHYMKEKDCTHIFELMDQAKRIFVYGSGEVQHNVACELKRIFAYRQKLFYHIEGSDETSIAAQFMNEHDVVFMISLSGSSRTIKNFAHQVKEQGAAIISMTRMESNPLANIADENLYITTHRYSTGKGADVYASMTPFFIIVDMLFLKYLKYRSTQDA